ncbi:hypothetical protein ID866_4280 [Astraeus odoratus]|nr:hypothetical protein ID866_4280 [Astraeus odoratus]
MEFDYKQVGGKPITLDVYFPVLGANGSQTVKRPAIIYFHGGSLTVGTKTSWFPTWLKDRLLSQGFIFVSADYRLMPPYTGHDLVEDILDVFRFVATSLNDRLDHAYDNTHSAPNTGVPNGNPCRVDPGAIGVAGTSAGGLCAYLACMHAEPKPKVALSMYGMGGNFLIPHYLAPKFKPFLRGREILDPRDFSSFLHPQSGSVEPTSSSPLTYYPSTYHIPGYPSNPRMLLGRLYLQLGTYLDYYTGEHDPSLSASLRSMSTNDLTPSAGVPFAPIPEQHRRLFPQLGVTPTWPPTCLVHGTSDTAVPIEESRSLRSLLEAANVEVVLTEVDGVEHSFDYMPPAEGVSYEELYDGIAAFLTKHLVPST